MIIHHLTILMYLFNKKERYELKEGIGKNKIKYVIIVYRKLILLRK